jgi:hypothetical protein
MNKPLLEEQHDGEQIERPPPCVPKANRADRPQAPPPPSGPVSVPMQGVGARSSNWGGTFVVQICEDACEGQVLRVKVPDGLPCAGQETTFTLPPGVKGGQRINVPFPSPG